MDRLIAGAVFGGKGVEGREEAYLVLVGKE